VREQLEQKRLAWQAAKSDREHYLEQLKELNAEALSDLSIEMKDHQQKLEKAQQQFEKIGAVIWLLHKNTKKCHSVLMS